MSNKKLEIIAELRFDNKFYYKDNNQQWYTIAPNVYPPNSPIVSYTKFNDVKYYVPVSEEKINYELSSELERVLSEVLDDE